MEKSKGLITILALLLLPPFSGLNASEPCEVYEPYRYTKDDGLDVYHFPIVPGSPEWKEARIQHREGLGPDPESLLAIPDTILSTMSTKGLAWTCLKSPQRNYWIGSSTLGLPVVDSILPPSPTSKWIYHKLRYTLLMREDAPQVLIDIYHDDCWRDGYREYRERVGRLDYRLDMALLESWLAGHVILDRLNREEKERLLVFCASRYEQRSQEKEGNESIRVLMGRILMSLGSHAMAAAIESNPDLKKFLSNPQFDSMSQRSRAANVIPEIARGYLLDREGK